MSKFRIKNAEFEAFKLGPGSRENWPWWAQGPDIKPDFDRYCWDVWSHGMWVIARPGDYLIQDTNGGVYVCYGDTFEATYEKVE